MKHVVIFDYSITDRLDDILDKIFKYGGQNLTQMERDFLDSFSCGREKEIHNKLKFLERGIVFDDGEYFRFEYTATENHKREQHFIGTLYVPDLIFNGKKINGCLSGRIIKYKDGNISLFFENGKYDIFEFCSGIEYELDSFVDYVISELEKNHAGI